MVSNFNQSEARKQCFLASDWLKFETVHVKFRPAVLTFISKMLNTKIVTWILFSVPISVFVLNLLFF